VRNGLAFLTTLWLVARRPLQLRRPRSWCETCAMPRTAGAAAGGAGAGATAGSAAAAAAAAAV
jgi:hypothetical protein